MAHLQKSVPSSTEDPSTSPNDVTGSRHVSFLSGTTTRPTSSRKTVSKPKTLYQLAHPPPINRSKKRLKIRPPLLLQLQKISSNPSLRAVPALDVLPASIFGTRLSRRLLRIFEGKGSLGPDDLVIVSSESYGDAALASADGYIAQEGQSDDSQEVIGTICLPRRHGDGNKADLEICLNDGWTWRAKTLSKGTYEFTATKIDGSQIRARWVPRPASGHGAVDAVKPTLNFEAASSKRFTFSIIDPNTRRHPVIASMTDSSIEIPDDLLVSQIEPWNGTTSSPPGSPAAPSKEAGKSRRLLEQKPVITVSSLRSLILVTGILVIFKEGWSPNFSYAHQRSHIDNPAHPGAGEVIDVHSDRASTNIFRRHSFSKKLLQDLPSIKRANSAGAAYMARKNQRSQSEQLRNHQLHSAVAFDGNKEHIANQNSRTRALSDSFLRPGQRSDAIALLGGEPELAVDPNGLLKNSVLLNSSTSDSDASQRIAVDGDIDGENMIEHKGSPTRQWRKVCGVLGFVGNGQRSGNTGHQ